MVASVCNCHATHIDLIAVILSDSPLKTATSRDHHHPQCRDWSVTIIRTYIMSNNAVASSSTPSASRMGPDRDQDDDAALAALDLESLDAESLFAALTAVERVCPSPSTTPWPGPHIHEAAAAVDILIWNGRIDVDGLHRRTRIRYNHHS